MALDSAKDVRDACLEALVKALRLEEDGAGEPEVVATIAYALGHLDDERAGARAGQERLQQGKFLAPADDVEHLDVVD